MLDSFREVHLRKISEKRRLVEHEGRQHAVRRGRLGWLHFENLPFLAKLFKFIVHATFTTRRGVRNALDIKVEEVEFCFENLPAAFDGVRMLFLVDLHIDRPAGIEEKVLQAVDSVEYDYCILGGDYSFAYDKGPGPAFSMMRRLAARLVSKSPVFGVLGNHDRYRIAEMLQSCGVRMLINENICLERGADRIYLAGVDDYHYFGADDVELANEGLDDEMFKIVVSHSPEFCNKASSAGFDLQLSGHTHGGQVCLPNGRAPVTCATIPRQMVKGKWELGKLKGYTCCGAGVSGVAVRYFCRPEITVVVLRRAAGSD